MRGACRLITLFLLLLLCACAAQPPHWRTQAFSALDQASAARADQLLPTEYNSAREALLRGEELLMEGEKDYAESFFFLAYQKAELVRLAAKQEEIRLAEEAARLAEERRRADEARRLREEASKLPVAKVEPVAPKPVVENAHHKAKPKERLVASYTVRSGESLPLIAAQPEVYNDRNMWPLLYRANRDQIRDPRHIWPGQVLRVPRNTSREDIAEARRYAQEKPLR